MKKYPKDKEDKSTAVRIPKGLLDELEKFLKTDYAKNNGYHHKSDVVSDAVRELLEKYKPRFEHINTFIDHATIIDYQLKHLINIYFKDDNTVWCEYDQKQDCIHIDYILELETVQKALKNKDWTRKNQ